MMQGIYWVWKEIGKKKGVKTFLLVASRFGKAKRTEMDKTSGMDIINKRPSRIEFTGVSKEDLQAAVDKAIAKVEKDMKSQAKYKADAPKRKAAAAKYQAEKRKTDMADYAAKYGKGTWGRVTYKQEGGDDGYAYVLRVDGRAKYNGLTQREAMHYKEREVDALAKAGKLGKYAEAK
jgi:flavin-binding protein dodecin